MQPVRVTVDARDWMSALEDITLRAPSFPPDRSVMLRIDSKNGNLLLLDADSDSFFKVSMPAIVDKSGSKMIFCRVQVRKLQTLSSLVSTGEGELLLTCRSATLTFQLGTKHCHVPNFLLKEPGVKDCDHFFADTGFSLPEGGAHFYIPDSTRLLQAIKPGKGSPIRLRMEAGLVNVNGLEIPCISGKNADCLLPGEILFARLSQLPESVSLNVVAGERWVVFSSVKDSVQRTVCIRPYPRTSLYLPKQDPGRGNGQLLWTNPDLSKEREAKTQKNQPPDGEEQPQPSMTIDNNEDPFDHALPDLPPLVDEESNFPGTGLLMLEQLPGLETVKKQIREIVQFAAFEKKRAGMLGTTVKPLTLHMSFLGNPGTGKTMVARLLGRIYKEAGLLAKGHVVEVDRQTLVGAYMGHTEANLVKYVKRALGGILFIDEAYALYKKDSSKDFGMNVIHGLVKIMEDYRDQLVVIAAGYRKEMAELIDSNPGLRERIPFHVDFPDYSGEELLQIAEYMALQDQYKLSDDAKEALLRLVQREKLDETFGNARTVRNLLDKAKIRHAARATEDPRMESAFTTLEAADFSDDPHAVDQDLDDALGELEQLVGLEQVKRLVKQIVDVLNLEKNRAQFGLNDEPVTFHMAFTGNPGTGKTTVARILGRIFKVMGLLPRGHFVEASRKDLVSGYVGQTALKTAEKVKEALGGVLFIDEAYALNGRGREDFGKEAIATLIKEMEDRKGLLTVILAGYTKEMEGLFQLNPGLRSRVRFFIHFPDYTPGELVEIVRQKAAASRYRLSEAAEEKIWNRFLQEWFKAGSDFGNGRLAEKVFEQAKLRMSERIARLEGELSEERLSLITEEDIAAE